MEHGKLQRIPVVPAVEPERVTTLHLSDREVASLVTCLGNARIWGAPDAEHIGTLLTKLREARS